MSKKPWPTLGLAILFVLALIVAGLALGAVRGRVVNPATALPVSSAVVTIDGRPAEVIAGGFSFAAGPGRHIVRIEAPGYESVNVEAVSVPLFGVSLGPIELRNASVLVKIAENFPGNFPVSVPAAVIIGRSRYTIDGVASLKGLPIGAAAVTVSAPGYTSTKRQVNLLPGDNSVEVTLTPDLSIVASRTAGFVMAQDYGAMWAILHPDIQRRYRGGPREYIKVQTQEVAQTISAPFTRVQVGEFEPAVEYQVPASEVSYPDTTVVPVTLFARVWDGQAQGIVDSPTRVRIFFAQFAEQWRVIGIER